MLVQLINIHEHICEFPKRDKKKLTTAFMSKHSYYKDMQRFESNVFLIKIRQFYFTLKYL